MLDEQEKQKKTLIYLGIAVVIVVILTIIGSFFTKSDADGTQNNDYYVFLEVQEDQVEQFIDGYINSKDRFYEDAIVTSVKCWCFSFVFLCLSSFLY